jgi:N-acetyl-gamma-glutamyl-phosphate reductase
VVDDYYKGMATTIMLHTDLLAGTPDAHAIHDCLAHHYEGQRLVSVLPFGEQGATLYANKLSGTNKLLIVVCGNDRQVTVTALFDNLGKGASGAAVQNMNIVLGLDETTSLIQETTGRRFALAIPQSA